MIKNLIIVIIIIAIVFLSQQPQFRGYGKDVYAWVKGQVQTYYQKAYNYVQENIYPRIGGEVNKRKDIIQGELQQEKEKISQSFWQQVKNYISDLFSRIFNPSGQTAPDTTPTVPEPVRPISQLQKAY